jgi:hypothetical protein
MANLVDLSSTPRSDRVEICREREVHQPATDHYCLICNPCCPYCDSPGLPGLARERAGWHPGNDDEGKCGSSWHDDWARPMPQIQECMFEKVWRKELAYNSQLGSILSRVVAKRIYIQAYKDAKGIQ